MNSVPDRLWHYTTTPSLLSIVESRRLWATDVMYLNDSRELLEGAGRLAEEAKDSLADPTPDVSPVHRLWLEIQRSLGSDAQVQMPKQGPFVASFCSEGDLLSQWRGYATGSGYAIGFSVDALRTSANSAGGSLLKVIYEPADPVGVSLFQASARTVGESGSHLIPDPAALAKFKHPAFKEEHEWRLVVPADRVSQEDSELGVHFRSGELGVTPYLKVGFPNSAIVEIKIGPGGEQTLRQAAVQRMLDAQQISADTSISAAPFRG